jgi:hypothetical protein
MRRGIERIEEGGGKGVEGEKVKVQGKRCRAEAPNAAPRAESSVSLSRILPFTSIQTEINIPTHHRG